MWLSPVHTVTEYRDNSGLLGTLVYYSLKLGGGGAPLAPLWSPPPEFDRVEDLNKLKFCYPIS